MPEAKDHPRVSPAGRAIGKSVARLAERGRSRLVEMGLDHMTGPGLRDDMCKTCACQVDSVPNGCLQTQLDFLKSAAEGRPFQCHAPLDGKICAGWVRARAELVARPLPAQVLAMLAKHAYSTPDAQEPTP